MDWGSHSMLLMEPLALWSSIEWVPEFSVDSWCKGGVTKKWCILTLLNYKSSASPVEPHNPVLA